MGQPKRRETDHGIIDASLDAKGDFALKGREYTQQFIYVVPNGSEYEISFDSQGRVVAKIERISP